MTRLKTLNLSNNKLTSLEGLSGLQKLQYLNVSFNFITSLKGMIELHGDHYDLRQLDIQGNRIAEPSELRFLAGCNVIDLM